MFETLFSRPKTVARHRDGPLAPEREQYLLHCAAGGATIRSQFDRARGLLWIAERLSPEDYGRIDQQRLLKVIRQAEPRVAPATAHDLVRIVRPWMKFIGWWDHPMPEQPFADQLERFVHWMRDERGLTQCTIEQWRQRAATFLRWCDQTGRDLAALKPDDIDAYFVTHGAQRWSRISAGHMATALRIFLRHAAMTDACAANLASSIHPHRRYRQETLPYAVGWDDVRRLIGSADSSSELDLRDRAIMMLLAIYGLRRGEVSKLRLADVDLGGKRLHIWRLKRRQPQSYPLVPSVAKALRRYIDARPVVAHPEVFIGVRAPHDPLTPQGIYTVINGRLHGLNVQAAHLGPHSLRHACATKMLSEGLSLKEIGDHLGHRSASSTLIYAKVDMTALRQVGDFDLGGLQ